MDEVRRLVIEDYKFTIIQDKGIWSPAKLEDLKELSNDELNKYIIALRALNQLLFDLNNITKSLNSKLKQYTPHE